MDDPYSICMNLNYYEIFYYVAISENITQTARILNTSQPSISRAISLLEHDLQQTLFLRSKNGVKLTKSGEILFEYISHGINWIKKGELAIAKSNGQAETLTVGASQLSIKTLLPPILRQYEEENPDVNLILRTSSTIKIVEDLKQNLIDIAIVPDPVNYDPDLEILKIQSFESILVCGHKYKNELPEEINLAELNNYPFIGLSHGTAGRKWMEGIFNKLGLMLLPTIEVQTSDVIVPLVKNDLGLGIIADILVKSELEAKEVFQIKIKETLPKRSFMLVYTKDKLHKNSCSAFIDMMNRILNK